MESDQVYDFVLVHLSLHFCRWNST